MNELSRRIGKFDSPESLLKAYESLNKEFTKRCQRLKELEKHNEELVKNDSDRERLMSRAGQLLEEQEFVDAHILNNEGIKNRVIDDYLMSLKRTGAAVPGIMGAGQGSAVLTPVKRPKDLGEAKKLADIILNS